MAAGHAGCDTASGRRQQERPVVLRHVHVRAVYRAQGVGGVTIHARCCGHSCIPWGIATELQGPNVVWFEQQVLGPGPNYFVTNGYATLALNGTSATEAFHNQTGQQSWSGPVPDVVPVVCTDSPRPYNQGLRSGCTPTAAGPDQQADAERPWNHYFRPDRTDMGLAFQVGAITNSKLTYKSETDALVIGAIIRAMPLSSK